MNKLTKISFLVILSLLILLPRIFNLDAFQTADEKRWIANTTSFATNLAHGDWGHLMQQPHPGITTQWLGSATAFSNSWTIRKLPLVIGQIFLLLLTSYVFFRLTNFRTAFFVTLLLAINPLLVAHTRVYAMDSLLAHFLILSIAFVLLWHKTKAWRYLSFSAFAAAAAILSKISGLIIFPFILTLILIWSYKNKKLSIGLSALWFISFLLGLIIILPSVAINTKAVITDILTWLKSDDYLLHQIGPFYYIRSLLFFSTPLHLFSLFTIPFFLKAKSIPSWLRTYLLIFLVFAILFTIQMSIGSKKGDRYILPVFLSLDIIAALTVSYVFSLRGRSIALLIAKTSLVIIILSQSITLLLLHPHYLSYINPITQSFFGERRLGWGEGLDLAANYLNQLPNSDKLTISTYYPNEFANYFNGKTVPAHQHDAAGVNYVIIYRAMFERGDSAWETDVVNYYRPLPPTKVIYVDYTPMAWIYQTKK